MNYYVEHNKKYTVKSDLNDGFLFRCSTKKEAHYLCNYLIKMEEQIKEKNKEIQEMRKIIYKVQESLK